MFLLTKEVAGVLRVTEEHVRDLINRGELRAFKQGHRGGWRILEADLNKYIEGKYAERRD